MQQLATLLFLAFAVASLSAGCADTSACKADSDCSIGHVCVRTGALAGKSICVPTEEAPLDAGGGDIGGEDGAGGADASDFGASDIDNRDLDRPDAPGDLGGDTAIADLGGDMVVVDMCEPETDVEFCARLGANCGDLSDLDNCGAARSAHCGVCTDSNACGAITPNVCDCVSLFDDASLCGANDLACGPAVVGDDCSSMRSIDCGGCSANETCGAANSCECADGYTFNGFQCVDTNECGMGTDDCADPGGMCTNLPGTFECACLEPEYFGDGRTCDASVDPYGGSAEVDTAQNTDFVDVALQLSSEPAFYVAAVGVWDSVPTAPVTVSGLGLNWTRVGVQCSGDDSFAVHLFTAFGPVTDSRLEASRFTNADGISIIAFRADNATQVAAGSVVKDNDVGGACGAGTGEDFANFSLTSSAPTSVLIAAMVTERDRPDIDTPQDASVFRTATFRFNARDRTLLIAEVAPGNVGAVNFRLDLNANTTWAAIGAELAR